MIRNDQFWLVMQIKFNKIKQKQFVPPINVKQPLEIFDQLTLAKIKPRKINKKFCDNLKSNI